MNADLLQKIIDDLKAMKRKYETRRDFSTTFIAGYQQGLAEAREYLAQRFAAESPGAPARDESP